MIPCTCETGGIDPEIQVLRETLADVIKNPSHAEAARFVLNTDTAAVAVGKELVLLKRIRDEVQRLSLADLIDADSPLGQLSSELDRLHQRLSGRFSQPGTRRAKARG